MITNPNIFHFLHGADISGISSFDTWKVLNPNGDEGEFLAFLTTNTVKGEAGISSYENWVNNGNLNKTFDEYLNTFKGQPGLSVYDLWLQTPSNAGKTQAQYLASLKGEKGNKGPIGDKGPTGDRGPQGIQGITGNPGIDGIQGLIGPEGIRGEKGEPGDKGEKGEPGESGISAYDVWVNAGNTGKTVDQYLASLQGANGDQGPQGPKGPTGDKGTTGDPGIQGVKGVTGDRGLQGLQGVKGVTGDIGPAGPNGANGAKGATGNPGTYPAVIDCLYFLDETTMARRGVIVQNGKLVVISNPIRSLVITTKPTKTNYTDTEVFNPAGMVVTATFSDGTSQNVTSSVIYDEYVTTGSSTHTITYIKDGFNMSVDLPITTRTLAAAMNDFTYVMNGDVYEVTGWKETYNGVASTECILPNSDKVKI